MVKIQNVTPFRTNFPQWRTEKLSGVTWASDKTDARSAILTLFNNSALHCPRWISSIDLPEWSPGYLDCHKSWTPTCKTEVGSHCLSKPSRSLWSTGAFPSHCLRPMIGHLAGRGLLMINRPINRSMINIDEFRSHIDEIC